MARLQAELEALKRSRQDQSRVLEELKALKEQMAEMQKQPEPPPVLAKVPPYIVPQRMAKEITGKDGAPMVLIPEGEFKMGSDEQEIERLLPNFSKSSIREWSKVEQPKHRVFLDAFYMDQYEVTTSRYATFMSASGRENPEYWKTMRLVSDGEKPVIGVNWYDAEAYCEHYGKRLPTEAEWEKAARGTDGRTYPWGNEAPTRRHANIDQHFPDKQKYYSVLSPVGRRERGKSPYGVYDMAGNVWEWVSDWFGEFYYYVSPDRNSTGPSNGVGKVVRGGSWVNQPINLRSANRYRKSPTYRYVLIGFRCAQDAP